jgi:5'-3' exonuclease
MQQLVYLRKKYPEHFMVIAWDGGYARRKADSLVGVAAGIIPESYKEAREKAKEKAKEDPKKQEEIESLFTQMDQLKDELLPFVRCCQAVRKGFEGDDLIFTYCKYVQKWNGRAVVVSSDNDFKQVLALGQEITLYDAMKDEVWTAERFQMEFAFPATLYVDYGALVGETGPSSDNIFGVEGWGPKTSGDYIRQYGSFENIVEAVKAKTKLSKKEQTLLASIPRFMLARSLKSMDVVEQVPMPHCPPMDSQVLYQKFIELGFMSLLKEVKLLT